MTVDFTTVWEPTPKQWLFLRCPVYEVMYGGAKGGGKTDALLLGHVIQHNMVHERYEATGQQNRGRAIIVRKSFNRLKDIINRAHSIIPIIAPGMLGSWRDQDHLYRCVCGYRLEFGHMEGPQDHQNYQGQEFTWLGVDQAEELPWGQYSYMKLQVRSSDPLLAKTLAVRCSANPLGRYSDWVKRRFIDPAPEGFKVIDEIVKLDNGAEIRRERTFIPATLADNKWLPPEYAAELMAAPEHLRRAYLYGDWNVTAGSFFGDVFDPGIHVIDDMGPNEIRIPSNWPVVRGGDWGARAPACSLWGAIDNDGMLIILDELYAPGENPTIWAKKMAKVEEQWGWMTTTFPTSSKLQGFLDPSGFSESTTGGPSVADICFENGIGWYPADNDRKTGWVEVRRRLMERGGLSGKIPGLRITRRCRNLIRTLPNLLSYAGAKSGSEQKENESHGEMDDIDTKQEDHAADALRYLCMSRPMPRTQRDVEDEEIKRWERIHVSRQAAQDATRNSTTGY